MTLRRGGIVLVIMFFFLEASAQNTQKDLSIDDFRTGIFEYTSGYYRGGKITRTKKWQIEEYPHLHLKLKFRVRWISDFEYHLTCTKLSDPTTACMLGQTIKVKILGIKDDGFTVLLENDKHFETVEIRMLDSNPKNQENFFAVLNNFKY